MLLKKKKKKKKRCVSCETIIFRIKLVYFNEFKLPLTVPEVIKTQELHLYKTET